ncbi:MAG: hypothetical protein LBN39_01930 [Planctomycetaceae bacterium]|jgi:hypothetical protein|nr:hypothetical protein [Planctomycetaceae bacterium]
MLPQNCGQLLYNAVRETLETMAFAEVVPYSIKVGDEETVPVDDFTVNEPASVMPVASNDNWGTAVPPVDGDDSWGAASGEPLSVDDAWGAPGGELPVEEESGGSVLPVAPPDGDDWGGGLAQPNNDAWGDSSVLGERIDPLTVQTQRVDFNTLVENQEDWCWACMKVNSPDINSIWFIVSKGLANALAQNMYAGVEFELTNPLIRDIIAELTNVLGGRLMLLLEELGGKFTLTVPEIGFGMPTIPDNQVLETIMCQVVVDGEYPVMAAMCFNQN